MAINISRFHGRERIELDCEIITPMFMGGSDQNAELRAASIKGLLRYWWRVSSGWQFHSDTEMYSAEAKLFGSPDDNSGRSRVIVEVVPGTGLTADKSGFRKLENIKHPEVNNGRVDPLNYLAGMGLIHFRKGILHSYFSPGGHFELTITAPPEDVRKMLLLFKAFAAAGSRSRNGWGSLNILAKKGFSESPESSAASLQTTIKPFTETFSCDYPHCLGADAKGLLLWQTQVATENWEDCLRMLADTYVKTRLSLQIAGRGKQERHLLGYPVTNHSVPKWNRHASALRLLVKKSGAGLYRGYILHIPHLFSKEMWAELSAERQKDIWRKVHTKLDDLMSRATLEVLL